ncbi:coenzyme F420-0:L-glutamate ligase [Youxingia wuxianensis]|uniref:Coenzyme F420-0:L-glutamate ligase n=1 Tax=Youxingia wuxianensis TaxID=2763678 RepID=A0A926EQV0_9FIRM|nr:coenzyme F420-0:L-glutamate ligase [Youxingia wuxianensis]MBC8584620.1 coenzyme F420-0:L-glutamate ligase [Youxingia wuxianensis]
MSNEVGYVVNPEKNETITVDGIDYRRLCIKTHVITDADNIIDVVEKYAAPYVQQGDIVFITEKAVACTQKRAIPMKDIHPRPLARFLCKFVLKTPYGIGLGIPETMEMALQECGTIKILFAAAISAIGKLFGKRGWFYNIAGYKARSIDGPCEFTLPPYNHYVVLGPAQPDKVAAEISDKIGVAVAITDINDLEGQILGTSSPQMDRDLLVKILKDNPLGQTNEQTPMGIIRKAAVQEMVSQEEPESPVQENE